MFQGQLETVLAEIGACRACAGALPHPPRPIVRAARTARVLIVGQAPGRRAHESGIPWNDASGNNLREWLQMSTERFYDGQSVAIVPMGFCFPGKGAGGDLPPRRECAPLWHSRLAAELTEIRLTLLVGSYAQRYYLGERCKSTLGATVAAFADYLPGQFPLPHPSPRNRVWLTRNPWFERDVLPELRDRVRLAFAD